MAEQSYLRQASVSDIENGKREVAASELVYFSYKLDKRIEYIFSELNGKILQLENFLMKKKNLLLLILKLQNDVVKKTI